MRVVAIVPAYNEAAHISRVIDSLPAYVDVVVVVDDASTDDTRSIVTDMSRTNPRIRLLKHDTNQGVGGAMVSGFRKALELEAQIVVKFDADQQMSAADIPALVEPLILGHAAYCKGNRFRDLNALQQTPLLRRAGNMVLSFLTKAAVGYWNCFDPCNGFVAIRGETSSRIPLDSVGRSYFFETSMLAQLYLLGAVVKDVPMVARYGDETSHMSIGKVVSEFPPRLLRCFFRRLILKNLIYDFSMESLYWLTGVPVLLAGVLYGGFNWIRYAWECVGAPAGTVVISAMLVILGFQLLLSAIGEDLRSVPHEPLCKSLMRSSDHRQFQERADAKTPTPTLHDT